MDELKEEMQILFSQGWGKDIIGGTRDVDDFFGSLKSKFQKPRYKRLHQSAYDELGYEGKNPVINHNKDFVETFKQAKYAQWGSRR